MTAAAPVHGVKALEGQFGRLGRAAALLHAGREMGASLDAARLGRITVETVEQALPASAAALLTFDPAGGQWHAAAHGPRGGAFAPAASAFEVAAVPFSPEVRRRHLFVRKRLQVGRHGFDAAVLAAGYRGYATLPVVREGQPDVVLCAAWRTAPGADELWFLEVLSVQAALALRSAALWTRLDTAEQGLARARDRADHASRLQALSQVASGVAHDFNNSLTTILGLSDWLLHELSSDTPFYADLEAIRAAAEDAAAMVRRLQMFSRLRPDAPQRELVEVVALTGLASPAPEPSEPAPSVAADALRPLNILVVDDEPGVRDSLAAMVSALGHAVAKAADGESALDLVIARTFDVVVTDLGLPGMSGAELARAIAACRPGTAVVCVTAWDGDVAAQAGAVALSKPVTMEALSQSVRDAHARRASRAGLRLVHSAETAS